jgi:hypothetical protein
MEVFKNLSPSITTPLEQFRKWVWQPEIRASLEASVAKKNSPHINEGKPDASCTDDYLKAMNHERHVGYPVHMHGIDINYKVLQKDAQRVDPALFEEIRARDEALDDELQTFLGAKFCALKAFYPQHGHIGWHNNWNAPGYNIIFTYSEKGDGYWRHIEPNTSSGITPNLSAMVHIPDAPGWHCKVGYFGSKKELDRVKWHCAYTNEPRLTVSYVIQDQGIWQNMVQEIREGSVN